MIGESEEEEVPFLDPTDANTAAEPVSMDTAGQEA